LSSSSNSGNTSGETQLRMLVEQMPVVLWTTDRQLRITSTHDALTGLANYREFVETLELDDLKRINDRLGHLTGNRALKRLASVMKQHCRSTDLAARYGGDEFALVLIDANPAWRSKSRIASNAVFGTTKQNLESA